MHYVVQPTGTPEADTAHYIIETRGSTLTIKAFASGLLSAFGHNPTIALPDFEGEIVLNPQAVEQSSLRLLIHTASLAATGDIRAKDRDEINRRMHGEVLESGSYPEIVYESSRGSASKTGEGQYWLALNGELTLHGVKRDQPVSASVWLSLATLRATGELTIRQSDYGIQPVSAVGGTIKLKDELKLSFNIAARKQA